MSIYIEVKCIGLGVESMQPPVIKSFFNCIVDAIGFLPNDEKYAAISASMNSILTIHLDQWH